MATSIGTLKAFIGADITGLRRGMMESRRLVTSTTNSINQSLGRTRRSLISMNTLFAAGVFGTGAALLIRKTAGAFLETAASFEQMKVQLDALTGGRGKETLEEINAWALEMPVNTQEAVAAFVRMKAFGLDPNIEKMQILTDVASIFGDEVLGRVSRALGQMAALGKLSAEELNQLSEAGINARKYLKDAFGMTVEEFQKSGKSVQEAINAIWTGMEREFGGSAQRMMRSWQGLAATFKSYITEIQRTVMDAGAFDALKEGLDEVNKSVRGWLEANRSLIKQKVPEYVDSVTTAVKGMVSTISRLISIYDSIPGEVMTVAAGGLVGKMLLGGTGGKIAITILGIDQGLKSLSGTIKSLGAGKKIGLLPDPELAEKNKVAMKELWEVMIGIRDWNSGMLVRNINRVTEEFDDLHDGITTATSDVEDFGYAINAVVDRAGNMKDEVLEAMATDPGAMFEFESEEYEKRLKESLERSGSTIDSALEDYKKKFIDWENATLPIDADVIYSDPEEMFAAEERVRQDRMQKWKDHQAELMRELAAVPAEDITIEMMAADPGAMFESFEYNTERVLEESKARWEDYDKWLVDLTQNTAERMQDNFSDVFFDAMTGELKSLEDYADAVFKSISRVVSDMLAKMAVEGLFGTPGAAGAGTGATGGGFGGIVGSLIKFLGFHGGGIAGHDVPSARGTFPTAMISSVPRLHNGLMPNEFPAILKRDEGVFTPAQMRALGGAVGGGGDKFTINVNVAAPEGRLPRQTMGQLTNQLGRTIQNSMRRNG